MGPATDVSDDIDDFTVFHDADRLGIDMGDVERIVGPDGKTVPGGSMKWHRPWEP